MNLMSLPLARLVRSRAAWVILLGWAGFALLASVVARRGGAVHGADHALLGAYGAIALPLLVYGVVAQALNGDSLARSGLPLVSFGASPSRVARVTLLVSVGGSMLAGGLLGAVVAAVAHGSADPPVARDVAFSAEIGAVGAAAYAAYFVFGASFGARGIGRSVLLVVDWVLGVGHGTSALLTPRAHVRSLLGGAPPLGMSARGSFLVLGLLVVVCGAIAVRRAGRAVWPLPRP
jgi:hypothetical protein